jgi:hypothetical protein
MVSAKDEIYLCNLYSCCSRINGFSISSRLVFKLKLCHYVLLNRAFNPLSFWGLRRVNIEIINNYEIEWTKGSQISICLPFKQLSYLCFSTYQLFLFSLFYRISFLLLFLDDPMSHICWWFYVFVWSVNLSYFKCINKLFIKNKYFYNKWINSWFYCSKF